MKIPRGGIQGSRKVKKKGEVGLDANNNVTKRKPQKDSDLEEDLEDQEQ